MSQTARKLALAPAPSIPSDPDEYYRELTCRNRHFINPEIQQRLRALRVLIAGCGSTGGACIEALARLGVTRFTLADNGAYELNNLNRQHAGVENIGENKAVFHARELKRINPFVECAVHPEGITAANVRRCVEDADFVFDAVDVTSPDGMRSKLELHRVCAELRKPVLSGLDMGYCQYGLGFDYRRPGAKPVNGRLEAALAADHPIKAVFLMFPESSIPAHTLPLVHELLTRSDVSASQLGCASDLLSGIVVAAAIRFVADGTLIPGWNVDLAPLALSRRERLRLALRAVGLRRAIRRKLAG